MTYQSTKASPPKIMVKNSDGSSVMLSAAWPTPITPSIVHTESATRHRALLAIFIVCCAQLVVAEYLVRLANLYSREPRSPLLTTSRLAKHSSLVINVLLGTSRVLSRRRGSCLRQNQSAGLRGESLRNIPG